MKKVDKETQEWMVINMSEDEHWFVDAVSADQAIEIYLDQSSRFNECQNVELYIFPMAATIKRFITIKKTLSITDKEVYDKVD